MANQEVGVDGEVGEVGDNMCQGERNSVASEFYFVYLTENRQRLLDLDKMKVEWLKLG